VDTESVHQVLLVGVELVPGSLLGADPFGGVVGEGQAGAVVGPGPAGSFHVGVGVGGSVLFVHPCRRCAHCGGEVRGGALRPLRDPGAPELDKDDGEV